ncbi:MAG: glycosyltransferase family 4 protein [Rhabdochlamydiaceae bacterium]|nr:glycosyltransferase family 4 protein [Candidatus Amphrikana amoebophyrae]
MKILITNTGPWGTGSFTVANAVLHALIKMGHEVRLFFPDAGIDSKDINLYYDNKEIYKIWKFPIRNENFSIETFPLMIPDPHPRVPEHKRTYRELSESEFAFYYDCLRESLLQEIKDFQPDIVECQHIWTMEKIIEEAGIPYVCTAHHSDQMGFLYDERIQPIAIEAAHNAKYIFAISKYVAEEVVRLYNVSKDKVKIITNGYDKEIFQKRELNRQEVLNHYCLDIPEDATIFSFAGKISKTKGIDILLKANKLIESKENIHFIILGSGKIEDVIDIDSKEEFLFDRVHFLGHRTMEELAEIHNICDFGILPSRSEGFGIACLESMACGLPLVSTSVGGLRDFVVGKLVPPANDNELASAILKLAHLPYDQKIELSQKALDVAQTFSWKAITEERVKYYNQALGIETENLEKAS